MAFELKMPKLGESVTEGTIGKWLKQPGDKVNKYDLLVEVQTDKVNTEIPSPVAGTLKEVKVEEGQTVPIGTLLAVFETADGEAAASAPQPAPDQPATQPQPGAAQPPKPSQPGGSQAPPGGYRARMSKTSSRNASRHSSRPRRVSFRHNRKRRRKRRPRARHRSPRSRETSSSRSRRCVARSRTTWSRPGARRMRTP